MDFAALAAQMKTTKPDLVALEHEVLRFWLDHRTFEHLRRQNADGERWSFLDGPITANTPMGVHHAWGRTTRTCSSGSGPC